MQKQVRAYLCCAAATESESCKRYEYEYSLYSYLYSYSYEYYYEEYSYHTALEYYEEYEYEYEYLRVRVVLVDLSSFLLLLSHSLKEFPHFSCYSPTASRKEDTSTGIYTVVWRQKISSLIIYQKLRGIAEK
jgi:hypothetical protein